MIIRREQPSDYAAVEALTRTAFYNIYVPGCAEHYLVHVMRQREGFVPELAFVAELNGKIIGNIMYTTADLIDDTGGKKEILTFGPVCIHPDYQRQGYGKELIAYSLDQAKALGYEAVVIFGSPANYVSSGFVSCKKYHVTNEDGRYPAAMMVKELRPGALEGRHWIYRESPAIQISLEEAQRYDDALEPMEKRYQPSQEEFYILSNSFLE